MVFTDITFNYGLNNVTYNDKNGQKVLIDENKPLYYLKGENESLYYLKIGTLKQIKSVSTGDKIVSFPKKQILGTVDDLKNKIKIDNDAKSEYGLSEKIKGTTNKRTHTGMTYKRTIKRTGNTFFKGGERKSRRNKNSKKNKK